MSVVQQQAVRLLSRKRGATVDELKERLELPTTTAARGLITRLRRAGFNVKNVGPRRFAVQ